MHTNEDWDTVSRWTRNDDELFGEDKLNTNVYGMGILTTTRKLSFLIRLLRIFSEEKLGVNNYNRFVNSPWMALFWISYEQTPSVRNNSEKHLTDILHGWHVNNIPGHVILVQTTQVGCS